MKIERIGKLKEDNILLKVKPSNEVAGNMALIVIEEENLQLRQRLFNGFVRFTCPLWNGVPCEEYMNTIWGPFFLSELGFDELGQSLPWDQRDDGNKISVIGAQHFGIYATGKDHPDRHPIVEMRIRKEFINPITQK